ncbi:MAG: outer membrane beta-barrel protein [Betaproteobacteria bacterium]
MKKIALIALLAATAAAPALAGDFYVAGSVGQSAFDVPKSRLDGLLTSAGYTGINTSIDKNDIAYKAQVGYQLNQYFAIEGGYIDFGKAKYSGTVTGGTVKADIKASGFNIAAVGILPINESFSLFGKLGVIDAKAEVGSASATKIKPTYGLGATYNVNKQLGIRVEYELFSKLGDANKTGEADVSVLSAGVAYKF